MGKKRRIPTISGHEGSLDPLFLADMLPDDDPAVIDIHGQTVAEAKNSIDLFLDRSIAAGTSVVKIIHGKGQGTLAMIVRTMLGRDRRVKQFRPSNNQIGAAVVAELDSG